MHSNGTANSGVVSSTNAVDGPGTVWDVAQKSIYIGCYHLKKHTNSLGHHERTERAHAGVP